MPLLFSYGTLQHSDVQVSLFGRVLNCEPDELVGFELLSLRIEDPRFATETGETYPIVRHNGRSDSRVRGTVFELSDGELVTADRYEPAPYERVATTLASGKRAWVYADSRASD